MWSFADHTSFVGMLAFLIASIHLYERAGSNLESASFRFLVIFSFQNITLAHSSINGREASSMSSAATPTAAGAFLLIASLSKFINSLRSATSNVPVRFSCSPDGDIRIIFLM